MDYELCLISRLVHLQPHCNNNALGWDRERERDVCSWYICQVRHKDAFLHTPSQRCKWADGGEMHEIASVFGTRADKNRGGEYCCRLQPIWSGPTFDIWIHSSLLVALKRDGSKRDKPVAAFPLHLKIRKTETIKIWQWKYLHFKEHLRHC